MRLTHGPKYQWIILAMATLGVLAAIGLGRFGYSAILPSMQKGLGLNNTEAGSLASWNLGGYVVMAAIGGFLASRFGARKVVGTGLAVTALGMLLTGLSGGLFSASLARLLTGVGSGLVLVPSVAMMATWFDAKHRGFASAIVASGPALALVAVGPLVPKIIASGGAGGWRLAWYLFAAVTICVGILMFVFQRDRPYEA
jgi:MFS family permease